MTKYLSRKFYMTEREKNDWYVEPVECTRALIRAEKIYGGLGNTILDPCCGQGNILNTLYEHGYHNVEGGDIEDRGYRTTRFQQRDFLEYENEERWDCIISNPPYRHAEKMAWKALRQSRHRVYLFLNITFYASMAREDLFSLGKLARVHTFVERITMYPGDYQNVSRNSGTQTYAWFVFDHGWKRPTAELDRISIKN